MSPRWKVKRDPDIRPEGAWSIQRYGSTFKYAVSGPRMASYVIDRITLDPFYEKDLIKIPAPVLSCDHPDRSRYWSGPDADNGQMICLQCVQGLYELRNGNEI